MAAVEVPQTLEYRGGQLNAAPVLEVSIINFGKQEGTEGPGMIIQPRTLSWMSSACFLFLFVRSFNLSRGSCILRGIYKFMLSSASVESGQRKPEAQWTTDERKAANLGQRLKSFIMSDFQDSPDDEEDTKSNHEHLNDLKEEYQAKALLGKSKRFFKKGTQRNTKDFEAKYNKVKAKLALLSSSASAPSSFLSKNKGLIADSHDWGEEEVSSDDEETEVKALMALTNEERIFVGKEGARNAEDFTLPNHDTDEIPSNKSQRNTTDPSAVVSDSPAPDYDSTDESSVCSTLFFPLKKLDDVEPGSGPKIVKSILKSKSTFKAKTLKGITLNEPSSAPARGNKSSLTSKTNSALAGMLKNVNVEDDPPLAMVKEYQEKDKIGSKSNKNGKRGEAGKSLKQLHWIEQEKLEKTQKEGPETQTQSKAIQVLKERRKKRRAKLHFP
nr:hypothetical protein [Tanacetum cinerariifolium]